MQRSLLLLGSLLVCAALTALVMARVVSKGENYAFMVACGEYDNPKQFGELPYTIKELLEFRDVLVNSGAYQADNIKLLHDKRTEDKKRWLPRKNNIIDELDLLLNRLGDDDSLTVVLNGHGLQPKGDVAYFCPLNADVTDKNTWIPLEGKDGLFEKLKEKKLRSKLLIVNACRDDPNAPKPTMAARTVNFDKKRKYEVPGGFAALFSCQPGQFSYYYDRTKNEKCPNIERSLFFHHLIEAWQGKYAMGEEMELEDVFKEVARRTANDADTMFADAQNPFPVRGYQGEWKIPIRRIVKELKEVTNSIGMKLVYIPEGTFSMGSPKDETDRSEDEDEHEVEITKGFYLGVYEVTQEEYEKVMEKNPSDFSAKGDRKAKVEGMETSRFPVENVSYKDAVEFCRKLSELPEEKQKNGCTGCRPRRSGNMLLGVGQL